MCVNINQVKFYKKYFILENEHFIIMLPFYLEMAHIIRHVNNTTTRSSVRSMMQCSIIHTHIKRFTILFPQNIQLTRPATSAAGNFWAVLRITLNLISLWSQQHNEKKFHFTVITFSSAKKHSKSISSHLCCICIRNLEIFLDCNTK